MHVVTLQVANEMGAPFNQLEMASFMTCSKGYMGECGIRGGTVPPYLSIFWGCGSSRELQRDVVYLG
jgi:hypothetical protein